MASRNSGVLLRQLFGNRSNRCADLVHHRKLSSNSTQTLAALTSIPTTPSSPPTISINIPSTSKPFSYSLRSQNLQFLQHGCLSSSPSSPSSDILFPSPSDMVIVKTKTEYKRAIKQVKDGLLPAVFYFIEPECQFTIMFGSSAIRKLREQFPHVTIYKIPIRQMGIASICTEMKVYNSPAFHLYKNGRMIDEICERGWERKYYAYGTLLLETFEKHYRYVIPVETPQRMSSSGTWVKRAQQLVIQGKKDENGQGVGGWKVGGAATLSQPRGAATLSQPRGAATLSQQGGGLVEAVESRSKAPSLSRVMRAVESLNSGSKLWWYAKGLFKAQPEKRRMFSKVKTHYKKFYWLIDQQMHGED